jgi:hypothetical protein
MTGDQITDQVWAAQGIPPFTTWRQLDPVRGAALANAVDFAAARLNVDTVVLADVLAWAKEFEAYLTGSGEEAHG